MALGVVALLVGTLVLIRGGDRGRDVASGSPSSIVASSTTTAAPTTTVAPTTTSTTAPTTTTTAAPGPASFTVAMAGDLLPHLPVDRRAAEYGRASGRRYDFGPMLAPMQPVVAGADLAICHLEVPRWRCAPSSRRTWLAPFERRGATTGRPRSSWREATAR